MRSRLEFNSRHQEKEKGSGVFMPSHEIVDDLEAALEQFREIAVDLGTRDIEREKS